MGLKLKMFALSLAFFFIYSISTTGVKAEGEPGAPPTGQETGQTHVGNSSETNTTSAPAGPSACDDGRLCSPECAEQTRILGIAKEKSKDEQKKQNDNWEKQLKDSKPAFDSFCKNGKCVLKDIGEGWKYPVCKGTRTLAAGTLLILTFLASYIF